ncbi:MAG TPA: hypothetical protein VHW71_18765 [Steroidobacteraceae bacterium]|jgi:hypothetical protein|nr:hypothetical protein [Steroidobacteraceae bacterium]
MKKKSAGGADLVPFKVPAGRARLPDGRIVNWPEETIHVPRDLAEEHQRTTDLLAALMAGAPITMTDWNRFATSPPMTGNRLYNTMARLSQLTGANFAKIRETLSPYRGGRKPGAKGKRNQRLEQRFDALYQQNPDCSSEDVRTMKAPGNLRKMQHKTFANHWTAAKKRSQK